MRSDNDGLGRVHERNATRSIHAEHGVPAGSEAGDRSQSHSRTRGRHVFPESREFRGNIARGVHMDRRIDGERHGSSHDTGYAQVGGAMAWHPGPEGTMRAEQATARVEFNSTPQDIM